MVSSTVRPVNTTWDLTGLMLPLIMSVVGISVLASCVIIIMIACLVRYRAKAKKHKNGKRMNTSHYKITVHAVEHAMCWSCGLQVYFKCKCFCHITPRVYCYTILVGQTLQLKSMPSVNRRSLKQQPAVVSCPPAPSVSQHHQWWTLSTMR